MKTNILVAVRDRIPKITDGLDVITHNSDYSITFDFDDEWTDGVKTVYFAAEDGTYTPVLMSGNVCDVPMLDGEHRRIFVGVQEGTSEKPGVLKTSRPCCLKVVDSIADYVGQQIPDPEPSVYEQIIAMLEKLSAPGWQDIANKPFSTLGDGLEVDKDGVLSAVGGGGGTVTKNAVLYTEQELTDEQKAQARENIGAWRNNVVQYWLKDNVTSSLRDVLARGEQMAIVTLAGGVMDNTMPSGIYAPVLVLFGSISYGRINTTAYDSQGIIWHGSINLQNYETNLTKTDTVTIDDTLTQAGQAADAKAVGDEFALVGTGFANVEQKFTSYDNALEEIAGSIPTVPTTLPNPNKLTFTGAVSGEYDGSEAVTIDIPQGGGGVSLGDVDVFVADLTDKTSYTIIEGAVDGYKRKVTA